jgi:probable F420-dependent oxidoreductase
MTGVGLCLPQLGPHVTVEVVAEFARRADELGYSGLWVQDHFMYPLAPERGYGAKDVLPPDQYKSVWAPTETLAFVAGITKNVALGTSILVAGNHWPVPLAQRLATIDQMSRGRLIVGLGVGWSPEEHVAAGTDVTERGRRMDDFVPTMLACWGPDPVSHDSEFFSVPESCVNPKPFGGRRPKLLSGMWSAQGLERTARWFDAWNPAGLPVGKVQKMVASMDAKRPAGRPGLEVYYRSFVQAPNGPAPADGGNMAALVADAVATREAGFADLCLEHNFWSSIQSPDDWLAIPDRFLPVLEAARG